MLVAPSTAALPEVHVPVTTSPFPSTLSRPVTTPRVMDPNRARGPNRARLLVGPNRRGFRAASNDQDVIIVLLSTIVYSTESNKRHGANKGSVAVLES